MISKRSSDGDIMATTVGSEFDSISEIYDSTRRAATEAELKVISNELRECHTILDVGIGTGRFAKPLSDLGFKIVGIDLSLKMMSKARKKGVQNLILADALKMPFMDGSFDASIIIHVFQLIPDWRNVTREMGRVTKNKVTALLTNRQREWNNPTNVAGYPSTILPSFQELWARYTRLREEMGYPFRRNKRMWQNEEEIRSEFPPMKLVRVSDEVVAMSINDLIARFQLRSYPMTQNIPNDVHDKVIQKLVSSIADAGHKGKRSASNLQEKQIERRIVEELAIWRPDQLRQKDHSNAR
jgi:ubiquinone/menaquinone biosynthesis C-methylase UbiE